jgi:hypothetical protein
MTVEDYVIGTAYLAWRQGVGLVVFGVLECGMSVASFVGFWLSCF